MYKYTNLNSSAEIKFLLLKSKPGHVPVQNCRFMLNFDTVEFFPLYNGVVLYPNIWYLITDVH